MHEEHLFRKKDKTRPLIRVVDKAEEQVAIIKALYDNTDYRGEEATYRRVAARYA